MNRNAHKQIHTVKDDSTAVWIVLYRDSFVLLLDSLGIVVRFENFPKKFSFVCHKYDFLSLFNNLFMNYNVI